MRLEKASHKAITYACRNFHYAKRKPGVAFGYSVFNKNGEWCGVILFGIGVGRKLGNRYNLILGQYLELNRMALNGKQESTSKAMSIAIKLIKKDCPSAKLLISYADKGQNHYGTIYQATNWYYVDDIKSSDVLVFYKGKWRHGRSINSLISTGSISREEVKKLRKRKASGKYKYIYPLHKSLVPMCQDLSKTYPKKTNMSEQVDSNATS